MTSTNIRKAIVGPVAVVAILTGLLTQTACSPASIQTVLSDVQSVVNFAAGLLQVLQGFGVLTTATDQKDIQIAATYVQEVDAAASKAVTEAYSKDSVDAKINLIYGYFAPIAPINTVINQKIAGSLRMVTASVNLMLEQLKQNGAVATPTIAPNSVHANGGPTGFAVPFTAKRKLESLKSQADKGVKMSALILSGKAAQ